VATTDSFTVAIRVKPGSRRARVGGCHAGAWGPALVIAVTEPAVDGRATEAALRATAAALGLRRSVVSLRAGESSRDKLIIVTDPPADLADRLGRLRDGSAGADGTLGGGSASGDGTPDGDRAVGGDEGSPERPSPRGANRAERHPPT
jgi:uncharacterized protein YggU (UPF0235/DUF167 family)